MVYNTMYPINQTPYYLKNKGLVKKREDEESSQSARADQENQEDVYVKKDGKNETLKEELQESKKAQALAIKAHDSNIKNATVNIAQILKDFRNTSIAIATPDDLTEEVNSYLALVENQASKDEPNVKLIKSNLKNASTILDNYISETLQRPSKVVENWIDALFLQQVNYKFDEGEVNPQFLVKFPEKMQQEKSENITPTAPEATSQQNQKPEIIVPQDETLKSLFIQAKKLSFSKDYKAAMQTFKSALERAQEVQDKETQSKILFEIGQIYDNNDYLAQALTSYNKSIKTTQDNNIKTKAHFSMAQIYDDVAQLEPAIDHYMSSVSFAGEADNLSAQSTSLTKIANIFSDKYDKKAFEFYSEAQNIAQESKNAKVKGYVSTNTANAYSKFNEPQNALKYYSDAVKNYSDAETPQKVAINYQKAAEIMNGYGNSSKAKSLLIKALENAQKANDLSLISKINEQLTNI